MKFKKIYKQAAKLVAENKEEFSCIAISKAQGCKIFRESTARRKYEGLFAPEGGAGTAWVFEMGGAKQTRLARTLALLLMVEMER